MQSIDLGVLKQLQEIFLTVFKHIDKPGHLKDLFQAVSTRLNYVSRIFCVLFNIAMIYYYYIIFILLLYSSHDLTQEPDLVRLMNTEEDEDNDVPLSELQLLSNDIPTSPVPESPLLQDDSDEDDLPGI